MYQLEDNNIINHSTWKRDFISQSPAELSTIFNAISQIYINIPREASVVSLMKGYFDLNFHALKAVDDCRYAEKIDISLYHLGPFAPFGNFHFTRHQKNT